ncbi:MAG: (Fe-S)-binding protein [Hyphomicrobiaceae bacterium]
MSLNDRTLFEKVFKARIDETASACTGCGKCFEVCPITKPAGLEHANPKETTVAVRDILRGNIGNSDAEHWSRACILSGDCIKACDYGVNPRLMLAMARMSLSEIQLDARDRRRAGVKAFAKLGQDLKILSRIQLTNEQLGRLGQDASKGAGQAGDNAPDVVLYTGCNVLKTPHIALLSLDILDALNVRYQVLGGTSHCCGVLQYRAGDIEAASRMGSSTIERFAKTGAAQVLSWCPSCQVQFSEINLPNYEAATSSQPLDMTPYMHFLLSKIEELRALMVHPVPMEIALHAHRGLDGVADAARELLSAVPELQLIDLKQPDVGLMSNALRSLPDYQKELQQAELTAAQDAGVDAIAAVYHADHRELCAHEKDWPFQVVNILEVLAASMGLHQVDRYKRMKITQDSAVILQDCSDFLIEHSIDPNAARPVIEASLLADQPLPLKPI